MPTIHPTAIVSEQAQLADDVTVGPFAIIDAGVSIGGGCKISAQAWITGHSQVGECNSIGYGAIVGDTPQDHSFDPSTNSNVVMGHNNTIRDYATIHRGTAEGSSTQIGDHNFLMIGSHLAHDVTLGNNNIVANNVLIAGHAKIGNHVFLSGGCALHQFLIVGDYSLVQGNSAISKDVPPFCVVHGYNKLSGLNVIGLRRGGWSAEERADIKRAYKHLFYGGGNLKTALESAQSQNWSKGAEMLFSAARSPSVKGLITT